jgi:dolichol kinase
MEPTMTTPSNQETEAGFRDLVQRTEGPQPWRRVFHITNGVLIVLALQILTIRTWTVLALLGSVLAVLLLIDGVRLLDARWNRLFFQAFSLLASPREVGKLASSTWYLIGVVFTLLIYPQPVALAGILVLAVADPLAGWVGRKWGKNPFGHGTVEGTLTFWAVASAALLPFSQWWAAILAGAFVALVEAAPWDVDDNLTIPIAAAGAVWALSFL